jgi:hypothetical protein
MQVLRGQFTCFTGTKVQILTYTSMPVYYPSLCLARSQARSLARSLSVSLALAISLALSLAVLDRDRRSSRGNRSLSSMVHLRVASFKNNFRRRLVLGVVLLDADERAQLEGEV